MDDTHERSLLQQSRDELTGGFHPRLLWRDRCRILADPQAAARPRPPLANSPLRFDLALGLTPLLLVAWLMAGLVALLPAEPEASAAGVETPSEIVADVVQAQLPGYTPEAVRNLARSVRMRDLPPEARRLQAAARDLMMFEPLLTSAERRLRWQDWTGRVRASALPPAVQNVVLTQQLDLALGLRRSDRFAAEMQRSVAEGGPVMQLAGVLSLVVSAWLFGQMLRHDPRFPLAARADAFYLYYTTSRLFWFLPAQALAYGIGSFASAAGRESLFFAAQGVSMAISAATLVWLLLGARTMARALADGAPVPGGGFAIGWRMLAGMGASFAAIMALSVLASVAVAAVSMIQHLS